MSTGEIEAVPVYHERTRCLVGFMRDLRNARAAHGRDHFLRFWARRGKVIGLPTTIIARVDASKTGRIRLWVERASDLFGVDGFRLD